MPAKYPKNVEDAAGAANAEHAYEQRCLALGKLLFTLSERPQDIPGDIYRISIRLPDTPGADTLVSIAGYSPDGTQMVAFHAAQDADEALTQALRKAKRGDLNWKVSKYG